MDCEFSGRVAMVTGAAHGIGRSICGELGRRGAQVYAGDVLPGDLEETVQACRQAGGACEGRSLDVTDEGSVDGFVRWVQQAEGRLDILVNVAGGVLGQTHQPLEAVGDATWNAILAVNLTGTFHCSRAVSPLMKEQRSGRIVNISSGAGRSTSLTGIQAYTSAKAGQIGLTRQLARELGPWNITVNAIAPGFVRSNPTTEKQWESYGPERQQALVEGIALRRTGRPEDIAYGVLFFASDLAAWCSGQVLSIDGGHSMF